MLERCLCHLLVKKVFLMYSRHFEFLQIRFYTLFPCKAKAVIRMATLPRAALRRENVAHSTVLVKRKNGASRAGARNDVFISNICRGKVL